ncbi:MAG TPA: hemolysin III family protein [Solirubrobacteraceae bacterium]|nr:hemolysin III family protein [Solirubrobacteraceae bacterium]
MRSTTPPEAISASAGVGSETLARDTPVKPRLRGVWHQYGFVVSLIAGAVLIGTTPAGRGVVAAVVYAAAVSGLLGTSALYHRVTWQPRARRRMRRLDHAMIFVLIAGSYTPIVLLAMSGTLAVVVFCVAWGGALAGVLVEFFWTDHPRYVSAVIGTALGWTSLVMVGQLRSTVGWLAVGGFIFGGILYTIGATIYSRKRPDPIPGVFGYHELFHALVLAAASIHYAVIAFMVMPRA